MKHCCLSRVTVGEGLVPHIEPSIFWLTNIKVTHDYANGVRIQRPMWCDEGQSFTYAPQEVDVKDHQFFSPETVRSQYGLGLGR